MSPERIDRVALGELGNDVAHGRDVHVGAMQHDNRIEIAPLWWTPGEGLRSLEIHRCSTESHAPIRSRKTPYAV